MIAIIDYKAGNAPSVYHAVNKLGLSATLVKSGEELVNASRIILPGVGSAGATMSSLAEAGFLDALNDAVLVKKIPFLGICVGMQILFERSEEENAVCLGYLKGKVVKFDEKKVRVPQMGWNKSSVTDDYFYFVNSYYALPENAGDIWGVTDYGGNFVSAVKRNNIHGVQFHAEKSGEAGLSLLKEFLC